MSSFGDFTAWFLGLLNRAPVPAAPVVDSPPAPSAPAPISGHCNAAGRNLIQSFEQCRLTAYLDSGGVPTIGWGHTGKYPAEWAGNPGAVVALGHRITQRAADNLFQLDLAEAELGVRRNLATWPALTSNQFSALCSFQFNTGAMDKDIHGKERAPTLMRALRAGDYAAAPPDLMQWVHDEGKVVNGLVRRRRAEVALWES